MNHNSKFLILSSNLNGKFHNSFRNFFDSLSIVNFADLFEDSRGVFVFPNLLTQPFLLNENSLDAIFLNHMKEDTKLVHTFIANQEPPNVILDDKTSSVRSKFMPFLRIMKSIENSQIKVLRIFGASNDNILAKEEILENRNVFMGLNLETGSMDKTPSLFTYEEVFYCAIVPIKNQKAIGENIFLKVNFFAKIN